jgi:hypothetical protein
MKAAHNQFTFENKVFLQLKQYVKMLKRWRESSMWLWIKKKEWV